MNRQAMLFTLMMSLLSFAQARALFKNKNKASMSTIAQQIRSHALPDPEFIAQAKPYVVKSSAFGTPSFTGIVFNKGNGVLQVKLILSQNACFNTQTFVQELRKEFANQTEYTKIELIYKQKIELE